MSRWEYMAVELRFERMPQEEVAGIAVSRIPQLEAQLNQWGDEGWEVVDCQYRGGSNNLVFVLKREKQ